LETLKTSHFDNLPPLSKEEAFDILARPINQLELSSDYYKAVFHLSKFPGPDTEQMLLDLVESDSTEHCIVISRRKAVEVLASHGCLNAIPAIGRCLNSSDLYLVENAVWALKELHCEDLKLIQLISDLLEDPHQNRRVLIQTLGSLDAIYALPRIKAFLNDSLASSGVKGAAIVAVKRLTGQSNQFQELLDYLGLPNQNDRHCAVNDIIDFGEVSLLPYVLAAPVAPSFRMRALNILWPLDIDNAIDLDLLLTVDSLIKDDPNNIEYLCEYDQIQDNKFLVAEMFNTDFRRCYCALKTLFNRDPDDLWVILSGETDHFKRDYGALYFLMLLFRSVSGWNEAALRGIRLITLDCLGSHWPDFIKFRPAAILTLVKLYPSEASKYIPNWLDETITPFWACRYATLLALEPLFRNGEGYMFREEVLASKSDSHRFVSGKAKNIEECFSF